MLSNKNVNRFRWKTLKRYFSMFLVFVLMLQLLPVDVFAAWDGLGSSGDTNASVVTGGFSLNYADERDILGYRFSVHDSTGAKVGESYDIDRYAHGYSTLYRAYGDSKCSHVELYQMYLSDSTFVNSGVSTEYSAYYWELDTSLPATPTEVEYWLTEEMAKVIAKKCEVYDFNLYTDYIIVEPIILAKVEGSRYACTMAEYACYQSSQYGWTGLGDAYATTSGTYRYNLMRPLSAYFGRYLYAVLEYEALKTLPVEDTHLANDQKGTPSVLLGSSKRFNTAEDVLKYQIGMAVYTQVKADNAYTLTVDPNGGTWNGSSAVQTYQLRVGETMEIPNAAQTDHTFDGWEKSSNLCTLSGSTYIQGAADCTLTAQYTKLTTQYGITFYGNGATSGTTAAMIVDYGSSVRLNLNGFKRTGYTFAGWTVHLPDDTTYTLADGESVLDLPFAVNLGDANEDGIIDRDDFDLIFDYASGNIDGSKINLTLADVNGDGLVDSDDANIVYKYSSGSEYPATVKLYARWEKATTSFVVNHFLQNDSGEGYTLDQTEIWGAATGSVLYFIDELYALDYDDYTYAYYDVNGVSTSSVAVADDGSTVVNFYYIKSSYVYTVNHYLETIDGTGYDLKESEGFEDTAGVMVTLENLKKTYTGFTYKRGCIYSDGAETQVTSTTLTGGLVINLYYNRNTYTLTVKPNGGAWNGSTADQTFSMRYGEVKTIADSIRNSYTFTGWTVSGYGTLSGTTYTQGLGDCTLTANYTQNSYSFTVNHFIQDADGAGFSLDTTETKFGEAGTTVTLANYAKTYVTHTYSYATTGTSTNKVTTASVSNGLVVNLYYTRNTVSYTVRHYLENTDGASYSLDVSETKSGLVGSALTLLSLAKTYTNFVYSHATTGTSTTKVTTATISDGLVINLYYTRNSASYTVKHYLQNANGSGYALDTTEIKTDLVGASLTLANLAKTYTGFNYSHGTVGTSTAQVTTATVLEDGSLVINLYYVRKTYTLTVKPNGGTWNSSTADQTFTMRYGETKTIPNPTRTGYTFTKWSDSSGSFLSGTTYTQGTSDCTLTANWDPTIYTITYDSNGGSAVASQTYSITSDVTLAAVPTRANYTFTGWKLSTAVGNWSATTYSASQHIGTGKYGDITLVAQWVKSDASYSVKHYLQTVDGTSFTLDATETVGSTAGDSVTLKDHSKSYTGFDYSYGTVGTSTAQVTTATVLEDGSLVINLYYVRKTYTLTVKPNGGTWNSSTADQIFTMRYGETKTIPDPTRSYYSFTKWSDSSGSFLNGTTYIQGLSDCTLTANWTRNSCTYTVNHYFQTTNGTTFVLDATETKTGDEGASLTLADFSKTYSVFEYSYATIGTSTSKVTKATVASGLVVNLYYTRNSYTLSVNPNGGSWNSSVDVQQFTLYYNSTKYIADPTREGYVFKGWTVDGGGILNGTTYTQGSSNCTLTAKWEKASYTLSIVPNGGTWNGSNELQDFTMYYGDTKTIANPTRAGYTFTGWTVSGGGSLSSKTYTQGTSNCTLTANWEKIPYTLKVDPNGGIWNGSEDVQEFTMYYEGTKIIANPTRTGFAFKGWIVVGGGTLNNTTYTQGLSDCTLTADWDPGIVNYTVNHYLASLTGDYTLKATDIKTGTTGSSVILAELANSYTGYSYECGKVGGAEVVSASILSDGSLVIDLYYSRVPYKLTVDPNGGSWNGYYTPQKFEMLYGETKKIQTPARDGFNFVGWTVTGEGTYGSSTYTQGAGDCTLTAEWRSVSYKITYDENGGSAVSDLSYTAENDVTLAAAPVRAGYEFTGWTLSAAVGNWDAGTYGESQHIGEGKYGNITLVAGWKQIGYTITYDSDGGSSVTAQNYTITTSLTLAAAPVKAGYKFGGWKVTVADGNWSKGNEYAASVNIGTGMYGNITLTAIWTIESYKITYDENGGSAVSDLSYTINDDVTLAEAPTRAGFEFTGWKLSTAVGNWEAATYGECQHIGDGKYGNITLVAQWKAKSYTITYDSNGGSGVANQTYTVTTNVTLAAGPTRAGYSFTGWKVTVADGNWTEGAEYSASENVGSGKYGNITLTATWEAISYTITYDANGGYSVGSKTYTIETDITLASPIRVGYTFLGWELSEVNADGNWDVMTYSASQHVGTGKYGNITLVAQWKADTYIVNYHPNGGMINGNSSTVSDLFTYGTTITAMPTPSRAGYTFAGWYVPITSNTYLNMGREYMYSDAFSISFKAYRGSWSNNSSIAFTTLLSCRPGGVTGNYAYGWDICVDREGYIQFILYASGGNSVTAVSSVKFSSLRTGWHSFNIVFNGLIYFFIDDVLVGQSAEAVSLVRYHGYNSLWLGATSSVNPNSGSVNFANGLIRDFIIANVGEPISASNSFTTPAQDFDLYASWTPKSYKITYDENGGSTVSDLTYTIASNVTLAAAPSRTGYSFMGWKVTTVNSSEGNWTMADLFDASQNVGSGNYGNVTLQAQWTANDYVLKVDPNGGIWNGTSAVQAFGMNYGSTKTIAVPTRVGYTFAGWTVSGGGSLSGTTYTQGTSNCTLTADWTPGTASYTVRHYQETLAGGSYDLKATETKSGTSDSTVTLTNLVKTYSGFTYDHGEVNGVEVTTVQILGDGTLVINLYYTRDPFTLTVNPNGGTWNESTETQTFKLSYGNIKIIALPSRDGYYFNGWTVSGGGSLSDTTYTQGSGNCSLTAKWERIPYTLTVDPNGGSWNSSTASQEFTMYYGGTKTIANPTRTGYTFTGWTVSGGGSLSGTTYTQDLSDCTLTANWEKTAYTLTVNPNGGTWNGSTASQEFTLYYGDTKVIANPTRAGYTFNGWTVSGGGSLSEITYTQGTSNCTLTANWTKTPYTLTVDPNGGTWSSSTASQEFTMYYGGTKTIANPTRTGYTFTGWTVSGGGSLSGTTYTQGLSDCTLTANWEKTAYTLTVNPNGGTWNGSTASQEFTLYYGDTKVIANPTRAGYTFSGWTVSGGGSLSGTTYTQETSNCTLTANWTKTPYTLTVDPNGGTWSGSTSAKEYTMYYGGTKTIANPTRTGYTFAGWTVSGGGSLSGTTYTQGLSDCTLTANWTPATVTYTVRHYLATLTGRYTLQATQSKSGSTGDIVTLSALVNSYTGYTYAYGKIGTVKTTTATILGDGSLVIDLYYDRNNYTLTVDPNGGLWNDIAAVQKFDVTYGETRTIADPKRDGYEFTGWTVSGDGSLSGTTYTQGAGDCTVTANWKLITYKITYDENGGSAVSDLSYTINDDVTLSSAPVRAGYTFTGWLLSTAVGNWDADTYGESQHMGDGKYGNITLVAQWIADTYVITYDSNGGTSVADQAYTITTNVTLASAPSRIGYTFTGWKLSTATGNWNAATYSAGENVGAGKYGNITLVAQWTVSSSLTLTYEPNGGTVNPSFVKFSYGSTITSMPTPIRTGYAFQGWYANFTGSSYLNLGREYMYTDKISIHLEAYMEDWAAYSTSGMRLISCTESGGFNIETSGGYVQFAIYDAGVGYKSAKSSVLWSSLSSGWHTFDLVFDGTYAYGYIDGTLVATSAKFVSGKIGYNSTNSIFLGAEATSDGSTPGGGYFTGYIRNFVIKNSTTRITSAINNFTTPASDFTLYAEWKNVTHTISCDPQGGTGGTDEFYEIFDELFYIDDPDDEVTAIDPPERPGYKFDGYYTEKDGGGDQVVDEDGNIVVDDTFFEEDTTIYADWTPISYKITYDENGGSAVSDLTYTIESNVTLAAAPTRVGYTFAGWKLSTAAGNWSKGTYGASQNIGAGKYGDITLVAQWTVNSYQVTYAPNGGTIDGSTASSTVSFNYGSTITSMPTATRTGYTFKSWYAEFTGSNYLNLGRAYMYTDKISIHLEAYMEDWSQYNTQSMRLISCTEGGGFNIENGNGYVRFQIYDAGVGYKGVLTSVLWSSLSSGWHTFDMTFDGTYMYGYIDGTLVATSAAFSSGKIGYNSTNSIFLGAEAGSSATVPASGYFTGYIRNLVIRNTSTRITSANKNFTTPAGNFTLYAEWEPNTYTITCNKQGGSGGTSLFYEVYEHLFYIDAPATGVTSIETPTRTAYQFGGYFTSTGGSGTQIVDKDGNILVSNTYFTSNTTIYAYWMPIVYTVTYNEAGGTSVLDQVYTIETYLTLQGTSSKTGYIFSGWKVTAKADVSNWTLNTVYDAGKNVGTGKYGDITLTAQWTPITYTIVYDGNGGNFGSTPSSTHAYDVEKDLTINGFQRPGYEFGCWNTKADGTGTSYDDMETVKNLTTTDGDSITLYAQWTPLTYDIGYDLDGGSVATVNPTTYTVNTATFSLDNPTRKGYVFDGWTMVLSTPNWYAGMINLSTGIVEKSTAYPSAVHSELIYLEAGVTYTISGTSLGGIRWRYYTTDGSYVGSISGSTFTPGINCYASVLLYQGCTEANRNAAIITASGQSTSVSVVRGSTGDRDYTAHWLILDIEISAVTLMYKDTTGNYRELTDLDNISYGTTVYVFHTYKNNSELDVQVNGYHQNSSGLITYNGTTVFDIAEGESITVLAGSFTPGIGSGTVKGYVYLNGYAFGDVSAELNESNNSKTVSYKVKFDLELEEIFLTNQNGVRVSERWIAVGTEYNVNFVVKNNSGGTVTADIYWNGTKYTTVTLAANSTKTITVTTFTPTTNGYIERVGEIYRKGYTASTEKYENDLANNKKTYGVTGIYSPTITLMDPECALRIGTETITSFTITNSDVIAFPNDDALTVTMYVYDANGALIKQMTQTTVVPAQETQLVWFRWTVPECVGPFTIKGVLESDQYDIVFDTDQDTREVVASVYVSTPDTDYEASQPSGWVKPSRPYSSTDSATWSAWAYNDSTSKFVKTTYGVKLTPGTVTITPNSKTAYIKNGMWYMKSGYGFSLEATAPTITTLSGYTSPGTSDYTELQWSYAMFPEFTYSVSTITTLYKFGNIWTMTDNNGYGGLHFTPIWYPDSNGTSTAYYVKLLQTEIWTPVGVLSAYAVSNGIYIEGDMYDDWWTH